MHFARGLLKLKGIFVSQDVPTEAGEGTDKLREFDYGEGVDICRYHSNIAPCVLNLKFSTNLLALLHFSEMGKD